jgi:ribonucleoside-diphosphate reductase alpha chain
MEIPVITKKEQGKTVFTDEFSKEVYEQTYRYGEEDIDGTHLRVAKDLASIEKNKEEWTEKFLHVLQDFKFVPGGRITSNAGTGLSGTTYINCFVDGFVGEDKDSMEGILSCLRRQALILKSEGGYGFCADTMRPRGAFIEGIGNSTPGAVRMLDMWDTQSAVITAGSGKKNTEKKSKTKIRKGAQMVTMSIWHPDIEEFITSKQTPGRLTKFNMSLLITDSFMEAVEKNLPWNLEFPDHSIAKSDYEKHWDGNLDAWKEKNLPVKVYKTFSNANELWEVIMESTYNRNEPGVLFVDTMNRMNNLHYCEFISATNPCGEQVLPVGGVCLLGSLNLTQFVDPENKDWDYEKLEEYIPIIVRLMDNVNDKTNVPLPSQEENLKNKRRIGLGYLGYGSALMMMRLRYGSPKALELTEKLGQFVANKAYQASSLLAKEKGSFPLFDKEKYLAGEFIKTLSQETRDMIKKYGIRNSHLLSIQPTGNSSVFANNVSGGLEPIFLPTYVRTSIQPYAPSDMNVPTSIDWEGKNFTMNGNHTSWNWKKEGDENLIFTKHNDETWKIDKNRGILKETTVKDYAVRYLESIGKWDPAAKWAATTVELSIDEHVKTMEIFSRYIDSAMSKTVNLPHDYPYEDFKKLYFKFYKTGTIKGGTTYRAGTMATVLSEVKDEEVKDENKIIKTDAPKRPVVMSCDVHHVTVAGKRWIVLVGILGGEPYEVFSFKEKKLKIPSVYKDGTLTKIKRGQYQLSCDNGDFLLNDIKEFFENDEQEALTRMISTALRHGAKLKFVVEQLNKSEGSIVSFNKSIARTLSRYIREKEHGLICDNCGEPTIILQEGCKKCTNCSYSAC